LSRVNSG